MNIPSVRVPLAHRIEIDDLRPTQITVGFREIETHAAKLKRQAQAKDDGLILKNIIPVVKGPRGRFYVIDHHHLCRALLLVGIEQVWVTVVLDLERGLDKDAFWVFMDHRGLIHPYDDNGRRCAYSDIPKSIKDLVDDPFCSLASALRRKGGYAKDTTPFSESLWAHFLRQRIDRREVEKNFPAALEAAFELAKKREANYLPGWCGQVAEDE